MTDSELKLLVKGSLDWDTTMNEDLKLLKKLIDAKGDVIATHILKPSNGLTLTSGVKDAMVVIIDFADMQLVFMHANLTNDFTHNHWSDAVKAPTSYFKGKQTYCLANGGQAGNFTPCGIICDAARGAFPVFAYTGQTDNQIRPETSPSSIFVVYQ